MLPIALAMVLCVALWLGPCLPFVLTSAPEPPAWPRKGASGEPMPAWFREGSAPRAPGWPDRGCVQGPFMIVGMFLAWGLLFFLFYLLHRWRLALLPPSEFVFPSANALGLSLTVSVGLGINLTGLAGLGLLRAILGRTAYREYLHRGSTSARDMGRLVVFLSLPWCLLGLIGLPLTMSCYARADADGIATRGVGAWSETFHPYDSVEGLTLQPYHFDKGKRIDVPKVAVTFDDGSEWESGPLRQDEAPRFVEWMEAKTGKHAIRVEPPPAGK